MEQIYLKRLGIILPERNVQIPATHESVSRGRTVRDVIAESAKKQRLTPEMLEQRKHWEEKLKEQEEQEKVHVNASTV